MEGDSDRFLNAGILISHMDSVTGGNDPQENKC